MSGYLLDTSVVSAWAPERPEVPARFASWALANTECMFIPTVAVAEIAMGIEALRLRGGADRASRIRAWLETLIDAYSGRILPVDIVVADMAGVLTAQLASRGLKPGFPDVTIAATAKVHDLVVLTRNLKTFEPVGVQVVDPLSDEFDLPTNRPRGLR